MLEKPNIEEAEITARLENAYALHIAKLAFLPLGADVHTAVYRVVTDAGTPYFLKARRDPFDPTSVEVPRFLSDRAIKQIIPPLRTLAGRLWVDLPPFRLMLYPFVEGRNAYEVRLSDGQWDQFGTALRALHGLAVPVSLARRLRRETYSALWRDRVREFLTRVQHDTFDDPIAADLAAFMRSKQGEIRELVDRTDRLARRIQAQPGAAVLCHSDIHAGNLLIADDGALYIVDWDEPILAPKERDLMYIGAGLLSSGLTPQEEAGRFYRSYGPTEVDAARLTYYRCERIVQDIAAYCEQLLLTDAGGEDRVQSLTYFKSNFLPNGTIAIAYNSEASKETYDRQD